MKKLWTINLSFMLACSIVFMFGFLEGKETSAGVKKAAAGYGQKAPSGTDLRHFIFEKKPYKKWALWPGKGKLSEGTEPHGDFITVYVNDAALASIKSSRGMADNSIVVKENYNKAKRLTSVTVMKKVNGYNPEGGDWFWARFSPDSKITHEGKVQMCHGCHAAADDNDYIFTGKVTAKGSPSRIAPGYGSHGKSAPGYGAPGYGKPGK